MLRLTNNPTANIAIDFTVFALFFALWYAVFGTGPTCVPLTQWRPHCNYCVRFHIQAVATGLLAALIASIFLSIARGEGKTPCKD